MGLDRRDGMDYCRQDLLGYKGHGFYYHPTEANRFSIPSPWSKTAAWGRACTDVPDLIENNTRSAA